MEPQTILLVDDDADFLAVLKARCQCLELEVVQSRNLLTALSAIEKRRPDIICLDLEMPTGNGLRFCQMLRDDERTKRIPIVILTGDQGLGTRVACQQMDVSYVSKSGNFWASLEPILRRLTSDERRIIYANSSHALPMPFGSYGASQILPGEPGVASPKTIVVANDDESIVQDFAERCNAFGCTIYGVRSGLDAIGVIRRVLPDLVCLDASMSTGNGAGVCCVMATQERLSSIPIVILADGNASLDIGSFGNMSVTVVPKDESLWERLFPIVSQLLELHNSKPTTTVLSATAAPSSAIDAQAKDHERLLDAVFAALGTQLQAMENGTETKDDLVDTERGSIASVLCIDDDPDFFDIISLRLAEQGIAVLRAEDGMDGYRSAFVSPARAILLDYMMPNGRGDYILTRLKDNPVTKDIPVIVVTGQRDKVLERRMLAMGAEAYLTKPINFRELQQTLNDCLSA